MTPDRGGRRRALRQLALGGLGTAGFPGWVEALARLAEARAHEHAQKGPRPVIGNWKPKVLDAHQDETVTVLSELIIPATDTPGAAAALVNRFVDEVLADAEDGARQEFVAGLRWLDARSQERFGAAFVKARPQEQSALLTTLAFGPRDPADEPGRRFFESIKKMTVTGYYTSEVGMAHELRDDGQVFFTEFPGCRHPEHGAAPAPAKAGSPAEVPAVSARGR
jgi:hypothetical protein